MSPKSLTITRVILVSIILLGVLLGGELIFRYRDGGAPYKGVISTSTTSISLPGLDHASLTDFVPHPFGSGTGYEAPSIKINPGVATPVDAGAIKDITAFERAYGFTFTSQERAFLNEHKFVQKNLWDTNIRPDSSGDNIREFNQLYGKTGGLGDVLSRGPQNAQFYSADVFLHSYNNLYTELLKEMENKTFYPAIRALSKDFYLAAEQRQASSINAQEKQKWLKVRNYFAIPYAIFETTASTLTSKDFFSENGDLSDPAKIQADHDAKDASVDTYDQVAMFLKGLHLDADSEATVLADAKLIYDAGQAEAPNVFKEEYSAYAKQENVGFKVDFTQFTPRGTYTSSSIRRQYFRGMKWYIMLPFFVKSPPLTDYAYGITELLAQNPTDLQNYNKLESAINFLVGTSDDLMPVDYLQALQSAQGKPDPTAATLDFLIKARDPKIKDLAATYATPGTEQSDEVRAKTKGLRFFSGKFIIDSYWTGFLTQGDEAIRPGYTQKLPPMASSLEVMSLLGSDYANQQIPTLDFYRPQNAKAIEQALQELKTENARLTEADWTKNIYTSWLWTIQSLFSWQKTYLDQLPRFMQSPLWAAKTLQTASASWTELRHATILYAKQSFAEMGGGPGACNDQKLPPPAKSYIEPQFETYARLSYLAKRTNQGLKEQGYDLVNLQPLEKFITLMDKVQAYTRKELENKTLQEKYSAQTYTDADYPGKKCLLWNADIPSEWEDLRLGIVADLKASIPTPVEGVVLPAKDRRAALVADIHTGGDSDNPPRILYEGTGVPAIIFVAVKDANGPRLTVGFTSSQYEFTEPYGGKRLTDEQWQEHFYNGTEPYDAFNYTDKATWPKRNSWYQVLFPSE